jgi:two-component system chemotaxis response regulator CheB
MIARKRGHSSDKPWHLTNAEDNMTGHNIIVMGTSAGGLKALSAVLSALPANLDATIFVVQHLAPDQKSALPQLLGDISALPVSSPVDKEPFLPGHIYVAVPDYQLLVNQDTVRVLRGPQENRFRPSIDALFRSAARAHGSRVIGVVLTGYLDDGTVGLQTIKQRGGMTVVQDPEEAEYPSMPRIALRYVKVDHTVAIADAGALLVRLVAEPAAPQEAFPTTPAIEIEANIAEQLMNTQEFLESVEQIGTRTTYTCPDCNGSIWQIGEEEPLKLRCHVGHSFTGEVFLAAQHRNVESALWAAIRIMEEKVTFSRQLAVGKRKQNMLNEADAYEQEANALDNQVTDIRDLILCVFSSQRSNAEDAG